MRSKRLLLFLSIIFLSLNVNASTYLMGLKFSPGLSVLDSGADKLRGAFSWNATMTHKLVFENGFFYGAEIGFSSLSGSENGAIGIYDFWGIYLETMEYEGRRDILYFSVPIFAGYQFKRYLFYLGVNIMMLLNSKLEDASYTYSYSPPGSPVDDAGEVNNYNLGPRFGISYHFFDCLSAGIEYYHSITHILDDTSVAWKFRQLILNVEYSF